MDIFELLEREHEEVKGLLERLSDTTENAVKTREDVFGKLHAQLNAHSRAEEAVFYRRLEQAQETRDLSLEGVEEHHMVDKLLEEMAGMDVGDEQWTAKLSVLSEQVRHHIDEEEKELFPKAKKVLGDEAEALTEAFRKEKKRHL